MFKINETLPPHLVTIGMSRLKFIMVLVQHVVVWSFSSNLVINISTYVLLQVSCDCVARYPLLLYLQS